MSPANDKVLNLTKVLFYKKRKTSFVCAADNMYRPSCVAYAVTMLLNVANIL